jgi:secreted trypsin-like serine protease
MTKYKFLALFLPLLAFVDNASAITYGQPDDNQHPNVGALIMTSGGVTFPYCSGTLIAPDLFLTAAHCRLARFPHRVRVTFETQITPGVPPSEVGGWFNAHAQFPQAQNNTFDIAIVVLDEEQSDTPLAQLPTAGQFDKLMKENRDQQFTAVGYGGEEPIPGPGGIFIGFLDTRQFSTSSLNAVTKAWLRLSQNPATGDGGTCFGDSGGPNFLGAGAGQQAIIAGITITGDAICQAANVIYRLDTPAARDFLSSFGFTLP